MTPERWRRIKEVLSQAMRRSPDERAGVLEAACGADVMLRQEVGELLSCRDQMGGFLEAPLFADPAESRSDGELGPDDESEFPEAFRHWTRYQVLGLLGCGGMARVYKAFDPQLRRTIALKVISSGDERTVARFLREAEAQARVDHDHVLKVFETGVVGTHHYIAMQHVDGPTLLGVRDETTLDHKVELMARIADGLHAAHRLGLVHRDIKPGNILVERGADGLKPYLLDFGLAAEIGASGLTQTGVILGTPRYMAPERIRGGDVALDRRSDIYGLGATFYEFLSGVPPFENRSGLQVLVDVLEADLVPLRTLQPTLPAELDAIIGKCLEPDPRARYPSARALADDLRRHLNGDAVLARPAGRLRRLAKKARRHPRLAGAFGALVLAAGVLAGWGAYQFWRSARQAELAGRLGQQVAEVNWLFRAAQMSPLHAIEPERRQVREQLARIEQMMRALGSSAEGPGRYALGRAYSTLGDHPRALDQLEHAWSAGYRTADAAMALGLAHGDRLQEELRRAERIASDRVRDARIRALYARHRDPARSFLNLGRASAITPIRYVDALVAAHGGDLDGAIERAAEAARATPWLFEAHLLRGHLAFDEAVRLYLRGQAEGAIARAREAARYYAEAADAAPSALDAYLGSCGVAGLSLHMILQLRDRNDPVRIIEGAEVACSRALVVDPGSAEAYRLFGEALATWAAINVRLERHPGLEFDRAIELARRAIQLSPDDTEAQSALADVLLNRAWWENRTGRSGLATVGQAIAAYEQVLAADPRSIAAVDNLGQALILRARVEAAQGLDPTATLDRAVAAFEKAIRVDPFLDVGFANLARIALVRADAQAQRGRDPAVELQAVLRSIEATPAERAPAARGEALARLGERLRRDAHASSGELRASSGVKGARRPE